MFSFNVNPLNLSGLPIVDRDQLPHLKAVYFVTSAGQVLYIGSSNNLLSCHLSRYLPFYWPNHPGVDPQKSS
jgi:hypothetical protein